MPNRSLRRGAAALATLAAAVLTGGLAAAPAHADGPVLRVNVVSDDVTLPLPANPDDPAQISWGLDKEGTQVAKDVHIVFDLSGIADFATTTLNCPHEGAVYTCDRGDIDDPGNSGGIVPLLPDADAAVGTTGTVTISGTAANGQVVGTTVKVTAGSPELEISPSGKRDGVKPGSTIPEQLTIGNNGSGPADGVTLRLRTTPGLTFDASDGTFSNCAYGPAGNQGGFLTREAVCHIDTVVEPGKLYRLSAPVGVAVGTDALYEVFDYGVTRGDGTTTGDGKGPLLSLVETTSGAVTDLTYGQESITADNTADLVAVGDSAQGAPGDTVKVTASLHDDGPGWVGFEGSDNQIALMVNIPEGTKAVGVPDECQPFEIDGPAQPALGKPRYICQVYPHVVTSGSTYDFTFELKIDKHAYDTTGSARATTVYDTTSDLTFDPDHGNDTASIAIDVTGRGTAPSGGGSSSPTAGPTTSASATATASGNAPEAQSGGSSVLASTGSNGVPLFAGAGAAALALGGALFLAVRRRRAGV
jgi:LPXTG-motif cell wall-anchored protein